MNMYLAVAQREVIAEMARHPVRSRFPHLRLIWCGQEPLPEDFLESLPPFLRPHIWLDTSPAVPDISGILVTEGTEEGFRGSLPVVTAGTLAPHYEQWMQNRYLPYNRAVAPFFPLGLAPVVPRWRPTRTMEVIGTCRSYQYLSAIAEVGLELGTPLVGTDTIRAVPGLPLETSPGPQVPADMQLLVLDLQRIHPAYVWSCLDENQDPQAFFTESVEYLCHYIDTAFGGNTRSSKYVLGIIEPPHNPISLALDHDDSPANLRVFIERLNGAVRQHCTENGLTFLSADAIAAQHGKFSSANYVQMPFFEQGLIDIHTDDAHDDAIQSLPYKASVSFTDGTHIFRRDVIFTVMFHEEIKHGEDAVKLAIFDLDNTLWRGLASDQRLGEFEGRPRAIMDAIKILIRRGVIVALCSKNDEDFIQSRWEEILEEYGPSTAARNLALEDFAMVSINFGSKAAGIGSIMSTLNILPRNTVFVDDNPLEREEVARSHPDIRLLGAELNYVARELVYSPFTQPSQLTTEDVRRNELAKRRVVHQAASATGAGAGYLAGLGLQVCVRFGGDHDAQARTRAEQLLNKTNQWNLNGYRLNWKEFASFCQSRTLVTATVADLQDSYGLVGVALVDPGARSVTHMAVSCRVMGMGVDSAFVKAMLSELGPLSFDFHTTQRNRACAAFLQEHGALDGRPVSADEIESPAHLRLVAPDSLLVV